MDDNPGGQRGFECIGFPQQMRQRETAAPAECSEPKKIDLFSGDFLLGSYPYIIVYVYQL